MMLTDFFNSPYVLIGIVAWMLIVIVIMIIRKIIGK